MIHKVHSANFEIVTSLAGRTVAPTERIANKANDSDPPIEPSLIRATVEFALIAWRRRTAIVAIVVAALVAALAYMLLSVPKYTATATIEPELQARAMSGQPGVTPAIDATAIVESEMRLLREPQVVHRVIERLVAEESVAGSAASSFPSIFGQGRVGSEPLTPAEIDAATARLARATTIATDARTYLISVSYSAPDPEEAAFIVNLLAAQYIHDTRYQALAAAHGAASKAVAELGITYGPKHPIMIRARHDLALANQSLETHRTAHLMTADELRDTGQVTPARALAVPEGPSTSMTMLVALLAAFVASLIAIHVMERQALRDLILRHIVPGTMR
ncbi:MAG: Wzz/FepE/Etk N-terminal domain-containing protein [Hyphomicrobium sp.]|nr:Wzz/FepE/Etk N-terminal domain-containing protein [Hyphomicrobium sp.]